MIGWRQIDSLSMQEILIGKAIAITNRNIFINQHDNQRKDMPKKYNRTESTSKVSNDAEETKFEGKIPSLNGNRTPYLNSDSKAFSKSMNRWEFGEAWFARYISSEMKFKLPKSIKSREANQIPSDRNSENFSCKWNSEKGCKLHNKNYLDCSIKNRSQKPLFSSRKNENIFLKINESYSNESLSKTIDLEEIQREVETIKTKMNLNRKHILDWNRISKDTINTKNREMTDNYICHNKKRGTNFFESRPGDLSPFKLTRPNEIKIPEWINREREKKINRFSDMNVKSKVDIWMNKNSFMPSLAPLPSLMKKFGDQVKEEKKKRESWWSTQFQTQFLIGAKANSISNVKREREENSRSMLSQENFIGKRLKAEKIVAQMFK